MTIFTWIIATLTILFLSLGIVAIVINKLETVPNWKKISKAIYWIISLVIFKFIGFGLYGYYKENNQATNKRVQAAIIEANLTRQKVKWEFSWQLPFGEIDQVVQANSKTFTIIDITRDDTASFWAIIYEQANGCNVEVIRLHLNKVGNDLIGTWANSLFNDGGNCYLFYKGNGLWCGHYELKNAVRKTTDCTLRKTG
jgi:hypothetical protein